MKLQKVDILNQGMSQDLSISKETKQEYAFENRNIRIQALDDGTLLSITNVRGPKKIKDIKIEGAVIGKCITKNYIVLFTKNLFTGKDVIYRIDINKGILNIKTNILYEGFDLHFDVNKVIDTLFYYENQNT
jgi:hypothetical protein